MDKEQRYEFIKDEYIMLQGFYGDIDERCITIKGWSITVGLAALGAGFVYDEFLFLGSALAGLLFWYLEGYYRGLSFFFSRRIQEIEGMIREEVDKDLLPLQVYHSWGKVFKKRGSQTWRYMRKRPVMLPHIVISFVGLGLYILVISGVLQLTHIP